MYKFFTLVEDIQNNGTSKSLHTVTEIAGMIKCLADVLHWQCATINVCEEMHMKPLSVTGSL